MLVKVYLEEAYNQVDWVFLENIVVGIGFSPSLTNLIMYFVRSTTISALWNGEKLDEFSRSHGLRQGDPLSHIYLLYVWKFLLMILRIRLVGNNCNLFNLVDVVLNSLIFSLPMISFYLEVLPQNRLKLLKRFWRNFVQSRDNV